MFIKADSIAPVVHDWLVNSHHPHVLHIFDRTCNLVNERGEILSVVTSQIGNGPFNLVIEGDVCFSEYLSIESLITVSHAHLHLGRLIINIRKAKPWSPRPDWEKLHTGRKLIFNHLKHLWITNNKIRNLDIHFTNIARGYSNTIAPMKIPVASYQAPASNLAVALAKADIPTAKMWASQLAGLGPGLTPAGDDVILGAALATWIVHPYETAKKLTEGITRIAAPLTTSLSAAWLRSAGRGETGIVWHDFFDALLEGTETEIQVRVARLLSVGETSGSDALTGFLSTYMCCAESDG